MSVLTKQVLAGVPALVAQGMKPEAIASQLGCKLSTLKVRCSQERISLRPMWLCRGRGRGRIIATHLSSVAMERFP